MVAPVTHVQPLTLIKRQRLLPVSGRVLVRKGQKVDATDVVAEARLASNHQILDLARGLGLSPGRLEEYLQRRAGERVSKGDVLAGPVGMTRRVIRASRPGTVVQIHNGKMLLELETAPFSLQAGLPGVVVELIEDRGVVIENTGALVQGVWGNGRVDSGMLSVLAEKPEDVLSASRLDVSMRGSVILAGYCEDPELFRTASDLPLRGLILSSMAASRLPEAAQAPFPTLITEGFGLLRMNSAAFNLLSTHDGREVALNAEPFDRLDGKRPEIVIPLPAQGDQHEPREMLTFSPNQRVRVLRAPHRSLVGTLVALRPGLETFPSGLRMPAAEVRLENGVETFIPLVNLEILD